MLKPTTIKRAVRSRLGAGMVSKAKRLWTNPHPLAPSTHETVFKTHTGITFIVYTMFCRTIWQHCRPPGQEFRRYSTGARWRVNYKTKLQTKPRNVDLNYCSHNLANKLITIRKFRISFNYIIATNAYGFLNWDHRTSKVRLHMLSTYTAKQFGDNIYAGENTTEITKE